jgi:protein-S-isoprenylcysteine O-methyltransferase Ste14
MPDAPKNAGVIAPPPLLFLVGLIAGFALDYAAPLGVLAQAPNVARWMLGGALAVFALAVNFHGFARFQRSGTPVHPYRSSTKLVTDGIFAHVRNPCMSA